MPRGRIILALVPLQVPVIVQQEPSSRIGPIDFDANLMVSACHADWDCQ